MFAYTDPVRTGRLAQEGDSFVFYRSVLHAAYVEFARLPNSGFTLLDAFEALGPSDGIRKDSVAWKAFPLTSTLSDEAIDRERFSAQDEYVEWQVERQGNAVQRVTFTTEFSEYYESFAAVGLESLVRAIQDIYPTASPTAAELFGPGVNPAGLTPDLRAIRFRRNRKNNPWNNGQKGILCLTQGANTLGALFNLVGRCAVPDRSISPADTCDALSGIDACGPGRASDPAVCSACQRLALEPRALSLADPAGISIRSLGGIWKLNGRQVDINDPATNGGGWKITRNGRRGVLEAGLGLTLGDEPISSGAQVANFVNVAADVISAPDAAVPAWAKLGQESSRVIA